MDRWILKQLRAQLLGELQSYIDSVYFDENVEQFKFLDTINSRLFESRTPEKKLVAVNRHF